MLPLWHMAQCFFWQFGQVGTSLDILLPCRPMSPCGVDEFPLEDLELWCFELCPMFRFSPDLFLLLSQYRVISFNVLSTLIARCSGVLALLLRVSQTTWTSPFRLLGFTTPLLHPLLGFNTTFSRLATRSMRIVGAWWPATGPSRPTYLHPVDHLHILI